MARARRTQNKDVISRLADAGEEALHRLAELPGGKPMLKTLNDLRERLDEVATKLRRLDREEARLAGEAEDGVVPPHHRRPQDKDAAEAAGRKPTAALAGSAQPQ